MNSVSVPGDQKSSSGNTGSPNPGEPVYLAIGLIRKPHGVRGEMDLEVWTDFPDRIKAGRIVFVGEKHLPMTIRSVRQKPPLLLIAFEGCEDRNQASLFRNKILYGKSTETPLLPEGEYYHHQLIGLQVLDVNRQTLGRVADIIDTPANDVIVIRMMDDQEILLPFVAEVVLEISIRDGWIRVQPQEWE